MSSPFGPDVWESLLVGDGQKTAFEFQWVFYLIDAAIPSDPNRCIVGLGDGEILVRSTFASLQSWWDAQAGITLLFANLVTGERIAYVGATFGRIAEDTNDPDNCFAFTTYGGLWKHLAMTYEDLGFSLWGAP